MPRVPARNGFQIRIYHPPREHGPPHVHVIKAGGEVIVRIGTGEALEPYSVFEMRDADVVRAVRIVEEMEDELLRKWGGFMATNKPTLTDAEILARIPAARARDVEQRRAGLRASEAYVDEKQSLLCFVSTQGFWFGVPLASIPALRNVGLKALRKLEVSPSGAGISWEELDVDLSVAGLVFSMIGSDALAQEFGRQGGRVTSEAKAEAARANGALGGRPKKARPASAARVSESAKAYKKKAPKRGRRAG